MRSKETGLEGIALNIGATFCGTYQGLGGTFASFVDCCTRKEVLAGFHQKGMIAGAAVQGKTLILRLSGRYDKPQLIEMMDVALQTVGAYPHEGVEADFTVGVEYESKPKKGR